MQTFLTIFSGITIFVLGQIIVKMVIEPAQELKKTIAKIKMEVHRYSFQIHNFNVIEDASKKETVDILKTLASELIAHTELISFYKLTSKAFSLPDQIKVNKASQNLISIVNLISIPPNTNTAYQAYSMILDNIEELKINLNITLVTGYETETITIEVK